MEQVFKTCRGAIVFDWDKFSGKSADTFQAALGSLSEDELDALTLYTQVIPHFVAEMTARNGRRV